jgi:hypothetical protein
VIRACAAWDIERDYRTGIHRRRWIRCPATLGQRVEDPIATHLDAIRNHPPVTLMAGSSRDAGRRERFALRTAARTYSDWRAVLEREQTDIVSVATHTPQHTEITVAFAQHGVDSAQHGQPFERSRSLTRATSPDLKVCPPERYRVVLRTSVRHDALGKCPDRLRKS